VGTTAYLFHNGTADVKGAISINDILTIYREEKSDDMKEAGKIKVLFFVEENYMKGEVVEGEIKPGDIARKRSVACLLALSGARADSKESRMLATDKSAEQKMKNFPARTDGLMVYRDGKTQA